MASLTHVATQTVRLEAPEGMVRAVGHLHVLMGSARPGRVLRLLHPLCPRRRVWSHTGLTNIQMGC
jgi:hypothetical protein